MEINKKHTVKWSYANTTQMMISKTMDKECSWQRIITAAAKPYFLSRCVQKCCSSEEIWWRGTQYNPWQMYLKKKQQYEDIAAHTSERGKKKHSANEKDAFCVVLVHFVSFLYSFRFVRVVTVLNGHMNPIAHKLASSAAPTHSPYT